MPSIVNRAGLGSSALLLAAAVGPAAILTLGVPAAAQRPVVLAVVDVKVVALGFRVSQLLGKPVYNPQGETIGHLDDFVVQRDKVLMTIINVGGFLGIGGRLVAIPYSSLRMTPKGIVLPGASKTAVGRLPAFRYQ